VIIADTRGPMVAENFPAAIGCGSQALRAGFNGVAATPSDEVRGARLRVLANFGRASAYKCGVAETSLHSAR